VVGGDQNAVSRLDRLTQSFHVTAVVAYDSMGESIKDRMDVSDPQQHVRQPASTVRRDKLIWLLNNNVLHVGLKLTSMWEVAL
jgi:aspartokinase-like uncharacterized kinase